jgi:LPXTG-motif cell wall-anchored protein
MVGEASSKEGFIQQAQLYLNNPQAIVMDWKVWVMIGVCVLIGLGTWLWFRRKR